MKKGDVAGTLNNSGYWIVNIKLDRQYKFLAHRIIYALVNNEDPGLYSVDHKDNDPTVNLELRKATHKQNHANRKPNSRRLGKPTLSKYRGVGFDKRRNKWLAKIKVDGISKFIGYFELEEEAAIAYNAKAKEAWGDYAYVNKVSE